MTTAVSVYARIKPTTTDMYPSVHASSEGVIVQGKNEDSIIDCFGNIVVGSDQTTAYDAIAAPLVEKLLEGYSCSLLAYGQTGSGKTHTIFGPPGVLTEAALLESDGYDGAASAPAEWGLFPRIALELLASGKGQTTLHASAVEVYQEKAFDLLADRLHLAVGAQKSGRQVAGGKADKGDASAAVPHKSTCSCRDCYKAKEEEKKARAAGTFKPRPRVGRQSFADLSGAQANSASAGRLAKPGLAGKAGGGGGGGEESFATIGETRVLLSEPADVARLARTIELTRTAVGHLLNARSSRSHCLVHLHLTEREGGAVTKRQLLLVDLAGSERILNSGATGVAAAQAVAINTSLTALGKVVRAVGARSNHVPYRDSTLTQLLRSSLSGHACTSVVIAVASDAAHTEESKCSLEFGRRMGAVRTRAAVVGGTDAAHEAKEVEAEVCEDDPTPGTRGGGGVTHRPSSRAPALSLTPAVPQSASAAPRTFALARSLRISLALSLRISLSPSLPPSLSPPLSPPRPLAPSPTSSPPSPVLCGAQLKVASAKLAEMEAAGYAEKFGPTALPTEIREFKARVARLGEVSADLAAWKSDLAELHARGQGRSEEARGLGAAIREASSEVANVTDLIARQKSVPGFWIAPRAVYTRKLAEVRALESRIEQMGALEAAPSHSRGDARVARAPPTEEPEGKWTAHVDEASGNTFYYNVSTGESTWDVPAGMAGSKRALTEVY